MNKDDLVVIAGAGGFIAGSLVRRFRDRGYTNIRAVDLKPIEQWYQAFDDMQNIPNCDLKIKENCYRVCEGAAEIYCLAADMGGMGFIESHKADCMLSVLINTHMLLAARDVGQVERYFYSSSACAYNTARQQDIHSAALKEEDAYPAMPEDGYGWEKLYSERMCRHFREDYGVPTRVARFHNTYGPHGTWDGGREKAPAAICRKIIQAIDTGHHVIDIWGDGEQTRTFMYIDDCLYGIDLIAHSDVLEPINLGSAELISINDLVTLVEEIAGIRVQRRYDLNAPKGVRGRSSDNTMIRQLLGWEPSIPLREGLEKTYAWIYDQYMARKAGKATVE